MHQTQTHGMKFLATLKFKFVNSFIDRHGKWRHYFRRPGCKLVPLPGLPGSAEFMEVYAATLADAPKIEIGIRRNKTGSVAAAVAGYFASTAFSAMASDTQRQRRRILERFRVGFATSARSDNPRASN
jgi:hypothetical protein